MLFRSIVSLDGAETKGIDLRRNGSLTALLLCVFVVMIGYGVALTILPLYTERIHGLNGASSGLVAFHLGYSPASSPWRSWWRGPRWVGWGTVSGGDL